MSDERSRAHRLAVALGICVSVAGIPALGAERKFDGVYSGKRVLTKGSGPTCPSENDVSVTIHGELMTFPNCVFKSLP